MNKHDVIVIEKSATGFSAFAPDLATCVAKVRNQAEIETEMKGAVRFHIDGMKQNGIPVLAPMSIVEYVEVCGE